jgi:signal transduction histidine kinase
MIADMMLFAAPPKMDPQPVDLAEVIDRVLGELTPQAEGQGTTLRRSGPIDSLGACVDAVHLAAALRAVCINSLEALGSGGSVEVGLRQAPGGATSGPSAEIVVRDTGLGIQPHVRRHLFDPFYSGRDAGRGLGFGLSKAWRIVTQHGGRIGVDSQPGNGATFTISLPTEQRRLAS